jgi:magnesium-transporting ATPase (P-type)
MAMLLWAAGAVAFVVQLPQLGIAIWMVNLINGVFSFVQEYRAERATAALRRLLPTYVRALRNGQELRIPAEEVVPGDVMLLAEGDHISADGRLFAASELRVDQSTLTGESQSVDKTSEVDLRSGLSVADLSNLVFAGTSVTTGTGRAVTFATGMDTEFGKIAHLTQTVGEEPSPLQRELARVTRAVSLLAVSIGVLFFILAVLLAGVNLAAGFVFAMGMIVAFVPEGMLPTVTLSLAMAVQRMARRNALVKRLSAVETLGCTTVICTDKTGTLTENEMTVREIWLPSRHFSATGNGYELEGQLLEEGRAISSPVEGDLRRLLVAAALCSNARLVPGANGANEVLGDPTEAALLVLAAKAGIDVEAEMRQAPRVRELPFDSRRKRMATVHTQMEPDAGTIDGAFVCVKGAPREILNLCSRVHQDGTDRPLDDVHRYEIIAANDGYARGGLRVLAVALRDAPVAAMANPTLSPDELERELSFLGLIAMMDPPRPEVAAAVETCHHAGIRIIMITGDYGLTAESIGRRIGVVRSEYGRVLSGSDLDPMDDRALATALGEEIIVARATPEHKMRVVRTLQAMGHIVAVTGDGVNDAPALKQADIGIAMGVAGTDVAREAADIVLADDNFASIVSAVEEGRAVFANIRKFAVYVFNSNMAEAVPFVVTLFSRGTIPLPLTVMQVLAIDLGTDMVPAIGLGSEEPEPGLMDRPPRSQQEPLLTRHLLALALLWYGAMEAVAGLSAYFFFNWLQGWPGVPLAAEGTNAYRMATTMTFAAIVAGQVGAVFGCRTSRTSIFTIGPFSNRLVLLGIAVEVALLGLLTYVPFLQSIFNTAPLGPREWAFAFMWAPVILLADEARKAWLRMGQN